MLRAVIFIPCIVLSLCLWLVVCLVLVLVPVECGLWFVMHVSCVLYWSPQ